MVGKVVIRYRRPTFVSVVAICLNCGWVEDDYNIAIKEARRHTQLTGHTVSIETIYNQVCSLEKK